MASRIKTFWIVTLGLVTVISLFPFSEASAAGEGRPSEARKSQRVIDFDDEVVEGVNKRPLDSLSQVSERDARRRKSHLYRKRAGFKTEMAETLRELRYVQ